MAERLSETPERIGDATDELYWRAPEKWIRAAIGIESGRDGSEIDDLELCDRYNDGGFAEWDPRVARAVKDYLISVGFVDLRVLA